LVNKSNKNVINKTGKIIIIENMLLAWTLKAVVFFISVSDWLDAHATPTHRLTCEWLSIKR